MLACKEIFSGNVIKRSSRAAASGDAFGVTGFRGVSIPDDKAGINRNINMTIAFLNKAVMAYLLGTYQI